MAKIKGHSGTGGAISASLKTDSHNRIKEMTGHTGSGAINLDFKYDNSGRVTEVSGYEGRGAVNLKITYKAPKIEISGYEGDGSLSWKITGMNNINSYLIGYLLR